MWTATKKLYKRLPKLSARFHIAMGLSSLLTTVVLLSMFLGFVPDRDEAVLAGRMALSEAIASSSSMMLRRSDVKGIKNSLEFIVERDSDLRTVVMHRDADKADLIFGEAVFDAGQAIKVPLIRGQKNWGHLQFHYENAAAGNLLDRWRNSIFGLMSFIGLVSFPLFYFYLGKMLKALNPSSAVPGRVRSALDTIAESLLVIDRNENLVLANSAFAGLVGKTPEDLLGVQATTLPWIQGEDSAIEYPWTKVLSTGESSRHDMIGFTDADGAVRKFIVNCSPVAAAQGKIGGVLISMDDVTLLEEKEALLRESMRIAEQANAAKSDFLSNMSHEIRTPMTAILGFTEVLKRGFNQDPAQQRKHLETISSSGQHLLELINDVLDLSKVESGSLEVEKIDTSPALTAYEVVQVLQVKADEKSIGLELDFPMALPESIQSDPSRLRQILTNLIGNAIKFTEQGRVVLSTSVTDTYLEMAVTDTGIGMTQAQADTIFDAFTQADASITRRFGGTGLGLSISRKLALAMGGDITVSSEPGHGSTFTLTIPAAASERGQTLSTSQIMSSFDAIREAANCRWEFAQSRVLVVDDGAENRELLALVLRDLGLDVVLAENGPAGA